MINGEAVSLVHFGNSFCADDDWLWISRRPRRMDCDNIINWGCFKGHLIMIVGHSIFVNDALQSWRMALANMRYRIEQRFQDLILRRARDDTFAVNSFNEGQLSFDGILRSNEDLSNSLPCS